MYCQNPDYKKYIHPSLKALWLAHIKKVSHPFLSNSSSLQIAGYRALCRWVGATPEDRDHDFWVNLGSADVKGIQAFDEDTEVCIPPRFFDKRWDDAAGREAWICKALQAIEKDATVGEAFLDAKEQIATGCKLRVGTGGGCLTIAVEDWTAPRAAGLQRLVASQAGQDTGHLRQAGACPSAEDRLRHWGQGRQTGGAGGR